MIGNITIKDVKLEIGSLIKGLRKKDGLTQQELGDKLGLSRITIQNIESGKNATTDTLLKVLQYWELLGGFSAYIAGEVNNNNQESLY